MMDDLITWVRAQLDEDERVARAANPWPWRRFTDRSHLDPNTIFGSSYPGDQEKLRNVCSVEYSWKRDENADHIARHDPARVLAEVEAKRRILDEHGPVDGNCRRCCHDAEMEEYWDSETETETVEWERRDMAFPCLTVRLLALPFADRDGYREAWRL